MTLGNITKTAFVALALLPMSACHIYNKFEMPKDNALAQ